MSVNLGFCNVFQPQKQNNFLPKYGYYNIALRRNLLLRHLVDKNEVTYNNLTMRGSNWLPFPLKL